MTTAAATAVAFAVAAALSFFVPRRLRSLLVVGVLVVPIALATPRFVRTERSEAAASGRARAYSNPPPFRWRQTNPALIAGIIEHVPSHESVSLVNANPQTGWIRWLAYSIAPRQLTRGRVPWTIVYGETPAQAGVHFTTQEWKYGDDWLVEQYFPATEKG